MKEIIKAYKLIFKIVYTNIPFIFITVLILSILAGLINPVLVLVNGKIIDNGILVSKGKLDIIKYIPLLIMLVILRIFPKIIDIFIYTYVEKKTLLMVRTQLRGEMLKKYKDMEYENLEKQSSIKVINKAFKDVEQSFRHLYPMYTYIFISNIIGSIGVLYLIVQVRWWLVLTLVLPFCLELLLVSRKNKNIYAEMDKYWSKDHEIYILGSYLKSRSHLTEIRANNCSDYLINHYSNKMQGRNKEYEKFFIKHLKRTILFTNITTISSFINAVLILLLYLKGQISIGILVSTSILIVQSFYDYLGKPFDIIKYSGSHSIELGYLEKFFDLSEDNKTPSDIIQKNNTIEFKDVWFKYPETDRYILKGITFTIKDGEKVSIVGENGEGKSTIIKLLLGLFKPNKGEILVGGKAINYYTPEEKSKLFGTVFQDFGRYNISLKENIGIGDIENINNLEQIEKAANKAKVNEFINILNEGYDTLVGREFVGGQDISGGQWQRIAIARAFMSGKNILILDEPTSSLDPIAESQLYKEFAEMVENKSAILITHRLASTMITDKVFVIKDGRVYEKGNHKELMNVNGIYANMFNSQKQWYQKDKEVG